MKICMIGTGYVGLVSGTCFADIGNPVYCVDKNVSKINTRFDLIVLGISPIHHLSELKKCIKNVQQALVTCLIILQFQQKL